MHGQLSYCQTNSQDEWIAAVGWIFFFVLREWKINDLLQRLKTKDTRAETISAIAAKKKMFVVLYLHKEKEAIAPLKMLLYIDQYSPISSTPDNFVSSERL